MHTEMVEVYTAPDENYPGFTRVNPIWSNVDRPNVGGWSVPTEQAPRLVAALLAGAALADPEVRVDINGQTYVNAAHLVSGRHLNADLKALGF